MIKASCISALAIACNAAIVFAAHAQGLFDRPACSRHLQLRMSLDLPTADSRCTCLERTVVSALSSEEQSLVMRDPTNLALAERARLESILLRVGSLTERAAESCSVPLEILRQPLAR